MSDFWSHNLEARRRTQSLYIVITFQLLQVSFAPVINDADQEYDFLSN